jgi:large subunit ribosomal protein L15
VCSSDLLGNIQKFIDAGKLDAGATIDEAALVRSGLVRRRRDGVRVLAKGELTTKGLKIEVTGASKPAVTAVEAAGGALTVTVPAPEADAAAEAKA